MAIKLGSSLRFTVTLPSETGKDILRWAKEAGMSEQTFVSTALILGAKSLRRAEQLMGKIDEVGAIEMLARLSALNGDKFVVGAEE